MAATVWISSCNIVCFGGPGPHFFAAAAAPSSSRSFTTSATFTLRG
uniref:Uncharacterized protein n=1 Tax=Anopheles funestus TaxID=62324 RepID=A0A182S4C7_ANOFN